MTIAPAWENMSALGGTRTPNLLIRRSMESVRPVRWNPYPQVNVLPGVRHRCFSPVPSGSVREKTVRDSCRWQQPPQGCRDPRPSFQV